ncbi:MAG: sigma-54 dependent transcriptional regulator [Gammaproteobacteria bacterium]|jgi:two-component system nitrogen regulation response regulator GlnG|nr:sigma-54 dependent transcriptional regulator [Gammaproteobacteria bacterium]
MPENEPLNISANTSSSTASTSLLLVDDDPLILEGLGFILRKQYKMITADSRPQALEKVQQADELPSLALIDLGLPPYPHKPDEGFALIRELLSLQPNMKVLVLSGQDNDVNIQHALTIGAVDFIAKPAEPELLLARLQHHQRLHEIDQRRDAQKTVSIIGDSVAMQMVNDQISQFADSPFPVLIEGASGTGKELVARALHENSVRSTEPYMAINCAAIAPDLLEAQLFGHAKGAFTGATQEHKGFFIEAGKGTLLLDEIGELPIALQGKLLRVIESGEFYRIGETREHHSQARIVAATNKVLRDEVKNERFRNDLYHRLSILNIQMPTLSQRGDDVFLLLNSFIESYADTVPPFVLDDGARELWQQYDYPGNVRELRNIVIRLGTKYPGKSVDKIQLSAELETQLSASSLAESATSVSDEMIAQEIRADEFDLDKLLNEIESRSIRIALELNDNNVSKAAKALKINRTTLYSRVQKLGSD